MSNGDDQPQANEAIVRVVNGPLVAPVLSRVVGMLAARAQCPVDRLDDALLVADAIAAHTQTHTSDGHVTVRLVAGGDAVQPPLAQPGQGGARAPPAHSALPRGGNL